MHFTAILAATALILTALGPASAFADGPTTSPPGVIFLQRSAEFAFPSPKNAEIVFGGALLREMHRQALLVAARDQLGLTTRDVWLGDWMPTEGANEPLEIDLPKGKSPTVEVRRGFSPAAKTVAQHTPRLEPTPLNELSNLNFPELVDHRLWLVEAESLSRTKYVETLRKCGFEGKANAVRNDAAVPEEIEKALDEMAFTAQFSAVRALHELVRSDGESPARLGALVRGYANLGLLTEFHWHPAHKVFKARALLYAQRMAARDSASALALWHRAYAFAAASLHYFAIKDVEAADKAWKETPENNRGQRPGWVELINAHCRFDLDRLSDRKAEERCQQLAGLLRYLAVELSGDKSLAVATGIEAVKNMPECYRIHDGVCGFGGVSSGHRATTEWLQIAGTTLYPRLATMPGLPEAAAKIVPEEAVPNSPWSFSGEEFETRSKLVRALMDSGKPEPAIPKANAATAATADAGEPSWAALGSLIRELSFVQAWRRVQFEHGAISVSTEEFMKTASPLFADHPYAAYIETFTADEEASTAAWKKLKLAHPEDLELQAFLMSWTYYNKYHPAENEALARMLNSQRDYAARDLSLLLPYINDTASAAFPALALLAVSPLSPEAMGVGIDGGEQVFRGRFAEWEKTAPKYPKLCKAFARRYAADKRFEDAIKWAKEALGHGPDLQISKLLANAYWSQGKRALWKSTLEEVLDQPDYELAHGRVCEILARHYMSRKDWEKAVTYAEAAAETGSAWGMTVASECYEGMHRWKDAEQLIKAVHERYSHGCTSPMDWYFFCRRTGHGDLAGARQVAKKAIASTRPPNCQYKAEFYLLEKKPKEAAPFYAEWFENVGGPIRAEFLALAYDELKDGKARDKALGDVIAAVDDLDAPEYKQLYPTLAEITKLIVADLAAGGKGNVDLAAADRALAALKAKIVDKPLPDDEAAGGCAYLLGKYLSLRGKDAEAAKYWKQAVAETTYFNYCWRDLSAAELCDHGIMPESYKSLWEKGGNEK